MAASPSLFRSVRADGPDILPLAPFLESLKSDGICTTLHDYERIHLALRGDGPWTPARLRSTLAALLVQDAEQERLLRQRFDQFFGLREEEHSKRAPANSSCRRGHRRSTRSTRPRTTPGGSRRFSARLFWPFSSFTVPGCGGCAVRRSLSANFYDYEV